MTADHLSQRLQSLRMWRQHDKRAPHKPLLLLFAIGRCLRGEERLTSFSDIRKEIADLLRRFGPPRKTLHPEAPFWHLQSDGVWEVDGAKLVRTYESGSPYVSDLKQPEVRAGLRQDDYDTLRNNHGLALKIAESLLNAHFPADTWHAEILKATGIDGAVAEWGAGLSFQDATAYSEMEVVERRRRNRVFKSNVLKAYDELCAVCEFEVRLEESTLAIEAAHVKWHSAAGPDDVSNGLALCSLHHNLFDRGAFTVRPNLRVSVARGLEGESVREALGQFDNKILNVRPLRSDHQPRAEFLNWHRSEVFRGDLPTRIQT